MKIYLPWILKKQSQTIWPIFIPFAGCKVRCIFCAQELQSGTRLQSIIEIVKKTKKLLIQNQMEKKPAPELGFFGGTFTAIDEQDLDVCCDFVSREIAAGRIISARCSTRPDAINIYILSKLKKAGFTSIELGIQSFNDEALNFSKRAYDEIQARQACALIKELGFNLGIQLMPGMPRVTAEIFMQDVQKALDCEASFLRLYPCQVIKDTVLANIWEQGQFKPWSLEKTIESLSTAWLKAHKMEVAVIRMGLAPEEGLDEAILEGPCHPALGNIVQGEALYKYVQQALAGNKAKFMTLPKSCQGIFGGHKNSLLKKWQALGVEPSNIKWHDSHLIEIAY